MNERFWKQAVVEESSMRIAHAAEGFREMLYSPELEGCWHVTVIHEGAASVRVLLDPTFADLEVVGAARALRAALQTAAAIPTEAWTQLDERGGCIDLGGAFVAATGDESEWSHLMLGIAAKLKTGEAVPTLGGGFGCSVYQWVPILRTAGGDA